MRPTRLKQSEKWLLMGMCVWIHTAWGPAQKWPSRSTQTSCGTASSVCPGALMRREGFTFGKYRDILSVNGGYCMPSLCFLLALIQLTCFSQMWAYMLVWNPHFSTTSPQTHLDHLVLVTSRACKDCMYLHTLKAVAWASNSNHPDLGADWDPLLWDTDRTWRCLTTGSH